MVDNNYRGLGSIEMLNDDTLLLIFDYLMQKEWLILETVCKRWFLLIRETWKSLKSIELFEILGVKPIAACEVQYFTPTIKEKLIDGMAERCSRILTEIIVGCRAKMNVNCLNILAVNFLKLSHLDLSKTALIFNNDEELEQSFDMNGVFGSLKTLNMGSCFDDSSLAYHTFESVDPLLFKLFSSMPIVETVNVGHNTMLNGSCLLGLSTSVESLDLSFCRRISGETLMLAFSSLPNLK